MIDNYPKFIPPLNLLGKMPKEWSNAEALEYLCWLKEVYVKRVDRFLDYLNYRYQDINENDLYDIGKSTYDVLFKEEFSRNENKFRILTNTGFAISADMGLLLARMLIDRYAPKIFWDIVKKPKSDVDYNTPVLYGFKNEHFNPIRVSIDSAQALLNGIVDFSIWFEIYTFWSQKAIN